MTFCNHISEKCANIIHVKSLYVVCFTTCFTIVLTDCQLFIYCRLYASCTIDITRNRSEDHQCFLVGKAHIGKLEVSCNVCSRSINMSKSNHVPNHLESSLHQKNVNLRKMKQAILAPVLNRTEDSFLLDFTQQWVTAGLPLSSLENPGLKTILKGAFKRSVPTAKTFISTVFTRIMTKLGLDDASSKFRFFVTDSAASNYVAAQMLNFFS